MARFENYETNAQDLWDDLLEERLFRRQDDAMWRIADAWLRVRALVEGGNDIHVRSSAGSVIRIRNARGSIGRVQKF